MADKPELDDPHGLEDLEGLDGLFAQARRDAVTVPEDLRTRVLRDALESQAAQQVADQAALAFAVPPREPVLRQFWRAVGGWSGLGGLATACAAGLWLGLAPPVGWTDPANVLLGQSQEFGMFEGDEIVAFLDLEGR